MLKFTWAQLLKLTRLLVNILLKLIIKYGIYPNIFAKKTVEKLLTFFQKNTCELDIVCVEVLRPSQPNGVMSRTVSLPNHTFTGQA